jgi:hypothetical protein
MDSLEIIEDKQFFFSSPLEPRPLKVFINPPEKPPFDRPDNPFIYKPKQLNQQLLHEKRPPDKCNDVSLNSKPKLDSQQFLHQKHPIHPAIHLIILQPKLIFRI